MDIYINKNNVKKIGSSILQDINDFYSDIKKIEQLIEDINNYWSGADELNYINKMSDVCLPKLYNKYNNFTKYGNYLKDVPGVYDLLDETFLNKRIGNKG